MSEKRAIFRWTIGLSRHPAAVVGLSVFLVADVGGCSWLTERPVEPAEQTAVSPDEPSPRHEPVRLAAAEGEVTLFGEFPDRGRVPFHARAASPMQQHTFSMEGADFDVDVSPDGRRFVFSSTRHAVRPNLYLKEVGGQAVTQLTNDSSADVQPTFSADGKWVAFASDRLGNWDIWLLNLEGGSPRQVTDSPWHEVRPSFSPDGRRLVYSLFNEQAENWELWVVDLDRPGSRAMIAVGLFPRWSPVADTIVYQRARERGGRWFSIWRVDLVDGEPTFPVEVASSAEMALIQPTFSRDGLWIAYATAEVSAGDARGLPGQITVSNRGDIWIVRSDGTSPLRLTDGQGAHFSPAFGPDGQVFFTRSQGDAENIWSVRPQAVPITAAPAGAEGGSAMSSLTHGTHHPSVADRRGVVIVR